MTDTPTPPMTPEQRAVLVAELRLPWFTNGCEWYQVRAANSLEADSITIATLTAERDAAKDGEKTARNLMQKAFDVNRKVIAERDAAQAEIEALQRELRATVAERNRAQKDCELIVKRFTPKPIRSAITITSGADRAKLDKAAEALQGLVRYQKSVLADVSSAHSNRGAGASEWMREDDRDFMRDLRAAFEVSAAALAEIGGA